MSEDTQPETQPDTTTFDYFGRSWTVPTKRHHRHILETKRIYRAEGSIDVDDIASIYLPADQYEALVAMDKPVEELEGFVNKLTEMMGLGSAGNSQPSSATS